MTLTEFLLARIAEDEVAVRSMKFGEVTPFDPHFGPAATHPARVLAECEAKRRIVERHAYNRGPFGNSQDDCHWTFEGAGRPDKPCPTLRALALPYADHDDYDETWRP